MVGKPVRSEVAQQLLSDLVWKLHNRVKPSFIDICNSTGREPEGSQDFTLR